MDFEKLLIILPRWIFIFLAIVVSAVIVHSLSVAKCEQSLFGLTFGPSTSCETAKEFPRNAVVAFNVTKCPDGWTDYILGQGRFVLGSKDGVGIASTGGSSEISLEIKNIPKHNHITQVNGGREKQFGASGTIDNVLIGSEWRRGTAAKTSMAGDGEPIQFMPPFVALKYCEKQ